jgi:hypothetical protein
LHVSQVFFRKRRYSWNIICVIGWQTEIVVLFLKPKLSFHFYLFLVCLPNHNSHSSKHSINITLHNIHSYAYLGKLFRQSRFPSNIKTNYFSNIIIQNVRCFFSRYTVTKMSAYSNENCGSEDKQGRDKNERTILAPEGY